MHTFGSLAWAQQTGSGRVQGMDKVRAVTEAVRYQVTRLFKRAPGAVGAAGPAEVERMMREVELPGSPLVAAALERVEALGPPALAGHAVRTWAFGVVLALRDGLSFDRETFALAALLHDLALAHRRPAVTCFAADGAAQAMELLTARGAPPAQVRTVGEAICLHLRVAVPRELGAEAHLVNAGAAVDVVGQDLGRIPPDVLARLLERHPRGDVKEVLCRSLAGEAKAHPQSRMALWVSLGFLARVRAARL